MTQFRRLAPHQIEGTQALRSPRQGTASAVPQKPGKQGLQPLRDRPSLSVAPQSAFFETSFIE